ncbi:polyphosphate kinase 1 [Salinisphaera orenii]|uniref:Polyphosphate kinase n=1 Tax=Salinisphaera orenii YIM 95161 TaxID=1051139 RepID=A0A423PWE3_9GAMM|nr:polyphosphate kinase 1 [Salinisphaera halophila]ROO29842.1 polyphosphate kinase [Salinisphaera halophila YIM 95161]
MTATRKSEPDAGGTPRLDAPELFINRELSLLEFNERVLAQARDTRVPLLERLKFLCISSTNLDEFFEVRVAGLKQKAELVNTPTEADNRAPREVLREIGVRAHELVDKQYATLNDELIPALEAEGIRFLRRSEWNPRQREWLAEYFEEELLPVISPLGLDPAHPFPRILNKSLNFIVALDGTDAFGRKIDYAVVQAPRALPRVIQLPAEATGSGPHDFVFLSSIIHEHVVDLFPSMGTKGCFQFRVTRNSDLFVDEEEVDDLLRAVEGELPSRRYGDCVRLEVAHNCPQSLCDYLMDRFLLTHEDLYQVDGPVNVNRLMALLETIDRPDLKYPAFSPRLPSELGPSGDLFAEIRAGDVLLHHPFDSFLPVIDFVRRAAADSRVLAIKQTLYRTGPDSAVVDALVEAAKAGKEVTVVVELRARFDEADNIELANRLQAAGAHVVYGVVGYKTHAKMTLIVRREADGLHNYIHLGTGNYHPKTARLYTDYGLFSCDQTLANDVHEMFLQLTSLGKVSGLERIIDAPFRLHSAILEKIEREAAHAWAGRGARIIAKMNSLVETRVIRALYAASQAGVEIDLIVRGICCLRPGVAGVSDNIRVRSIVGRFLEHTRVFHFGNDDAPEVYLASADWMDRNFFRRVETCFPVTAAPLYDRVMRELALYLADDSQAWMLASDGRYHAVEPAGDAPGLSVQKRLMEGPG